MKCIPVQRQTPSVPFRYSLFHVYTHGTSVTDVPLIKRIPTQGQKRILLQLSWIRPSGIFRSRINSESVNPVDIL
jgi:hypothetical protein